MKPHNFVFPGFAITSVGLVLIFWWLPEWAVWFSSPWVGWLGALAVAAAVVFGWRGWLASQRAYDLLLWGSLWLWLAGWLPIFSAGAPMFKAYPVYFILLDALTGHFVLGHRPRWSIEERRMLASLANKWWFDSRFLAGLVLVSLVLPRYYLLYPLAVGLLIACRALALGLAANRT